MEDEKKQYAADGNKDGRDCACRAEFAALRGRLAEMEGALDRVARESACTLVDNPDEALLRRSRDWVTYLATKLGEAEASFRSERAARILSEADVERLKATTGATLAWFPCGVCGRRIYAGEEHTDCRSSWTSQPTAIESLCGAYSGPGAACSDSPAPEGQWCLGCRTNARLARAEAALERLELWPDSTPEHRSITSQNVPMREFARAALTKSRGES